LMKH